MKLCVPAVLKLLWSNCEIFWFPHDITEVRVVFKYLAKFNIKKLKGYFSCYLS